MKGDLCVVVPVKPLRDSKTRLAGALDGNRRRALVRHFLRRTLRIVRQSRVASHILVISRDAEVLTLARREGAMAMREIRADVNLALAQVARGLHGAMLVLPLDLPMLDTASLRALTRCRGGRAAAIAPDRSRRGTNALLLQPADLIECDFGPDSFAHHVAALREIGVEPRIVARRALALDVDTPTDLAEWLEQ